jgi:hypothetical protein
MSGRIKRRKKRRKRRSSRRRRRKSRKKKNWMKFGKKISPRRGIEPRSLA